VGYLFFLCMGLGFLAKGPMAWVVPLSGAISWTWATRGSEKRLVLPWKSGVLLTFAVAMSWFVVVCFRYPELWNYFLGYELVERFASTTHGRSKPWWFFIPILVIGAIPWTGFLPGLARRAVEKIREKKMGPVGWFLGSSVVIPFVVVSCSGSKLLTYILPIYPALALGLAIWLSGKVCPRCEKVGWGFALISLGMLGPMLWCVRYVWSEAAEVTPSPGYLLAATLLAVILVLVWGMKIRRGDVLVKVGWVAGVAIFLWHGASWEMERINDLLGRQASVCSLAKLANRHQPERLFIYRARAAGLLFVTDRKVWISRADADVVVKPSIEAEGRLFEKPSDLKQGLSAGQKVEGITLRQVFREEFEGKGWEILGRAGEFYLVRGYGVGK
jgi:4-amino-4-deoxy-L-arabinose transferase-like glycosyltransferase